MNQLIETHLTLGFESSEWPVWIDRFDNDRLARWVTPFHQGHPVYTAPSKRDFYQFHMTVLYIIPKRLSEQMKVWFEGRHDIGYGISWAPSGRKDQIVIMPVPFMYTQPS